MPSESSPWHDDLESVLHKADLGFPENFELRWIPLQPFDDWIIHLSKDGHDAAVVVTANQMSLSEHMISLVNENASGSLTKIIATPIDRDVSEELLTILESYSIHLLRY